MSDNVVPFTPAERAYNDYVRAVEKMNADLTFENAMAARRAWREFSKLYDTVLDAEEDLAVAPLKLRPIQQ